jgi:MFS family permease
MIQGEHRRRSLLLLMVIQLTTNFRGGIISPILSLFIRGQGLSITEIGLLGTAGMLGWLIFEPLSGVVADMVRKKYMVIFAIVGSTIIYALYPMASNIWHFAALAFSMSSVMSTYAISIKALTAELLPAESRGKAYGRFLSIISFGGIIAPFLGGYLSEVAGYFIPFYLSAAIGLITLVTVFLLKYDDKASDIVTREKPDWKTLFTGSLLSIFAVRGIFMFNHLFRQHFLPIYLHESPNFQASESQIGTYMTLIRLTSALSQPVLGEINDKLGSRMIIITSVGILGLSYLGLIYGKGVFFLFLLGAVQGVLMASSNMGMMLHLMTVMPKSRTGMVMGLYSEAENVGGIIASPVHGFLYESMGAPFAIGFLTLILVFTSILTRIVIKDVEKKE